MPAHRTPTLAEVQRDADPPLFNTSTAAILLGIDRRSLKIGIDRKQVPAQRIGNRIYIARRTILDIAALEDLSVPPRTDEQ